MLPNGRSFGGNMALNRQIGAMCRWEIFDGRAQLCQVASLTGPRNSFQDFNSAKDVIGNVTARPLLEIRAVRSTALP